MIKSQRNDIKFRPDVHCHSETVPDNAAIAQCNRTWSEKISVIKNKITECKNKITEYNDLKTDIEDKKQMAQDLQGKFASAEKSIKTADLHIDFSECDDCLENLVSTFDTMMTDCDKKVDEWTEKQEQYEKDLEDAQTAKEECANITKIITVCE